MKLYFRLIWLILTQSRRSRSSLLGPVDTEFRVLPNDLDALMHVNNGVYLTLMDLGRTDLLLRSGVFSRVRKKGWYPVLAAETIRFKRSLKLWQRFSIRTNVVGWDDRSIYLEQHFISKGKLVAKAVVDARFLKKKGGVVTPNELLAFLELDTASPELEPWIATWVSCNRQMSMELTEQTNASF